jgi:dipeptidyl aminopeptidase/acylaminoacyl peptidase
VEKVKTPLLILHSEQDLRCPIGEAEQLFAALKKLRREVVFVRFPDESHDLSRNGKPAHRVERLRWIVRWFGEHLLTPAATPVREAAVAGGSEA